MPVITNCTYHLRAIKNVSGIPYNNLLLSSHEITSILEKTVYKELEKTKTKTNMQYLLNFVQGT